jgi:hypothetical protein
MIKVPFRAVLLSLIALVAIGGLVVPNLPQAKEKASYAEGACVSSGTGIVIDFGTGSNLEPVVRCVFTPGLNGWQLLAAAGLDVAGTSEYPASFVCRIDGFPNAEREDCLGTPGYDNGSWSYFYATGDSASWQRSPVGAATRKPKCGDIEGWLFSKPEIKQNSQPTAGPRINPKPIKCQ